MGFTDMLEVLINTPMTCPTTPNVYGQNFVVLNTPKRLANTTEKRAVLTKCNSKMMSGPFIEWQMCVLESTLLLTVHMHLHGR